VHWDWDATTAKHYIVQNGMVAEGWLGLGCSRIVRSKQIINWGMPELPSVVYGTAAQMLLLVMCSWIRRRSWGKMLLVLMKPRMVGGTNSSWVHLPAVPLEERGHIGTDGSNSKLLLLLALFLRADILTRCLLGGKWQHRVATVAAVVKLICC
jgi:hypothetical protein